MNLTRIKVKGYKNLLDCELHLGSFNVLIGPNNSGKSNLLEIFWFLNVLLTGSDELKKSLFGGYLPEAGRFETICRVENKGLAVVELEFTCEIESVIYRYWYYIELELGLFVARHGIKSEYFKYKSITSTGTPKTVFEREGNNILKLAGQKIQRIELTEPVLSIISKLEDIKHGMDISVQKGIEAVYQICTTPVLYYSPSDVRTSLVLEKDAVRGSKISGLALQDEIIKILESGDKDYFKEILADVLGVDDIKYFDTGLNFGPKTLKIVEIKFPNKEENNLEQLSDGTRIVLSIITYLFSKKHSIIAI